MGTDDVCLILGDNIFYGAGLQNLLQQSVSLVREEQKAVIFGSYVDDPARYGVVAFDASGRAQSIEEKPQSPKSHYAVAGLYCYPNSVKDLAREVQPSARGELEITSINQAYLERQQLKVQILGRGYAWLDTGTHESLMEAGEFVKVVEKRTGLKIACLEEIALNQRWIDREVLLSRIHTLKGAYYSYLRKLLRD